MNKCVNVCRLQDDRCIGCGRTIAEITEAGLRAENARQAAKELEKVNETRSRD